MAAKLVVALMAIAFVIAVVVIAAFWYFNEHDQRQHEKDLKQMEHTEKILESETEDPIDRELERGRNK